MCGVLNCVTAKFASLKSHKKNLKKKQDAAEIFYGGCWRGADKLSPIIAVCIEAGSLSLNILQTFYLFEVWLTF